MPAKVEPAYRFLACVAALGVRHAADFVEAHFLGKRLFVDFRGESGPARENAGELERIGIRGVRAGLDQPRSDLLCVLGGDGDLKDERRDVTRARYLEGHVAGRVLHDAIRGVRDGQARRSHDRDGMGSVACAE